MESRDGLRRRKMDQKEMLEEEQVGKKERMREEGTKQNRLRI